MKEKNYNLSLKLKATEVDVVLLKNDEHFASVQLVNFGVKVNVDKHNVAEIDGRLQNLSLEICCLRDTKWARMVNVEEAISFKVITYPRSYTEYPGMLWCHHTFLFCFYLSLISWSLLFFFTFKGYDVDLQITVSAIDVAYHQIYTLGMVAYFENFFEEFKNHFLSLRRKIEDLTEKDDSAPKEKPPSMSFSISILSFY